MTQKIPITLTFKEKTYAGTLESVMGAGSSSVYHLMVKNYYCGRLRLAQGKWVFDPTPKTVSWVSMVDSFAAAVGQNR